MLEMDTARQEMFVEGYMWLDIRGYGKCWRRCTSLQ